MKTSIALIGIPESGFADEVASSLGDDLLSCHMLSLDAPMEGKPVVVSAEGLIWEGVDLQECGAVFVERPLFSWPQTRLPFEGEGKGLTIDEWSVFQRETAALSISALLAAADRVRLVNPPFAAHMAASPAIALEVIAGSGLPVHPWRLEPAPPPGRSESGPVLDICGRERWHFPRRPGKGGPALMLDPVPGGIAIYLVVGGGCAGTLQFPDGEAWARWNEAANNGEKVRTAPIADSGTAADEADMAIRAARALGLDFAAVSIREDESRPSVVYCEASPDLADWNGLLGGRAAAALADYLASLC